MSLYLGNTVISGVTTPLNGSIAIGQIISSIVPLTDAGLHLLDGSLIQGGGIYNNFVQYIANLFNLYPQCFTDETTWQNTVNSKGVCGKFVYDSTNNTVRLPKITGFIEGTINSNALGDLVEAGLPNITGTMQTSPGRSGYYGTGALGDYAFENQTNIYNVTGSSSGTLYGMQIDASRSSSIYGNSNTVQPQAIKVFYYIVVATTTKTDIEVDIDEIVTDLNSKANDADVIHKTGAEIIGGVKTLTYPFIRKMEELDVTTAPLSDQYINWITPRDKNGIDVGYFGTAYYTDEKLTSRLGVTRFVNGQPIYAEIYVAIGKNGTITTYAPTPNVSSNGTNIATTAYVNTKFQVVSTLPANPNSNVYYFIPE